MPCILDELGYENWHELGGGGDFNAKLVLLWMNFFSDSLSNTQKGSNKRHVPTSMALKP
jgi:hypothetical protein